MINFRESNLIPSWSSGYSLNDQIIIAAENIPEAVSAVFGKGGKTVSTRWLNCGNPAGEYFPRFFQIAALFSSTKQKDIGKEEVYRIARNFLIIMLAELRIITVNTEIHQNNDFISENGKLTFEKYIDLLLKDTEGAKLTNEEKILFAHYVSVCVQAFTDGNSGHASNMPALLAFFECTDYEKSSSFAKTEEDRDELFFFHMTRLKLAAEKPALLSTYFDSNENSEIKERFVFMLKKIREFSEGITKDATSAQVTDRDASPKTTNKEVPEKKSSE
jgi:hypothetical protein